MNRIKTYFEESWNELVHKVSWPTWTELQGSVVVVMVASLIIALLVFGIDSIFGNGIKAFYNMFV